MTPERREQAEKEVREKLGWWIVPLEVPVGANPEYWPPLIVNNIGCAGATAAEVQAYDLAISQTIALAEAQERIAELEADIRTHRAMFWPNVDGSTEFHLYEIRNGKSEEYVRAHAAALKGVCLSLAADGLAEVLRWLDRRGGLGYDAHEEIQKRVAAYEKAKESR